jgi:hypothetical protein
MHSMSNLNKFHLIPTKSLKKSKTLSFGKKKGSKIHKECLKNILAQDSYHKHLRF